MKNVLFFLLLVFCFTRFVPVYAESDLAPELLNGVFDETKALDTPQFNFSETGKKLISGEFSLNFQEVLQQVFSLLFKEIKENLSLLIKMLVLSVLAGVLCNLQQSTPENGIGEVSFLACFAMIAGLSVSIVSSLSALVSNTIDSLMLFIASLMPVIGGVVASSNPVVLSGFYPTLFLAMQAFVALCRQCFLPLISVMTALSVTNAMSGRFHISRLIEVCGQVVKWGLGLLLTVFVGILGLHRFSVFAAGSIAGRTVKFALCNFIPIVGGVLSESIEAVIGSMRLIRGALGITGVMGILSLCGLPLIKLLSVSLLYRFSAGIAEPATDKRIVGLLMNLAGNITLLFSILLMVCVMFIISIALLCGVFFQ